MPEVDQAEIKGERGTGYEDPAGKGPFECGNCNYFRNGSCGQKTMMAVSRQPKLPGGRIKVDFHGCCEYVERKGTTPMAKEKEKEAKREESEESRPVKKGSMPKGKYLHKIITERVPGDETFVHHHVYKDHEHHPMEHPPRPMATSDTPEEAGEHIAEQFAGKTQPSEPQEEPTEGEEEEE